MDLMNGFEGVFVSGDYGDSNVTFDSANAKFGSALRFPRMLGQNQCPCFKLGITGIIREQFPFAVCRKWKCGNRGPYGVGEKDVRIHTFDVGYSRFLGW